MSYKKIMDNVRNRIFFASFAVLLYYGGEIYQEKPPIPEEVVTDSGEVIFTKEDIQDGQNAWRQIGGQELGSVWGHGAYVAPDWTADWLHRESVWLLDQWAQAEHKTDYESLSEEDQSALKARLKKKNYGRIRMMKSPIK